MDALLRACAQAWFKAGAPHLADLINATVSDAPAASSADLVPAALRQDYARAIASMSGFGELHRVLSQTGTGLPWMQGTMDMHGPFHDKFGYVQLAGPEGMIDKTDIRFGLYLQQRNTVYPSHWHLAVEDYLVLSGTALWQSDEGEFVAQPPGTRIHHVSNQPHAMTTQLDPLLAMWFWQGDIRASTYRIAGVST